MNKTPKPYKLNLITAFLAFLFFSFLMLAQLVIREYWLEDGYLSIPDYKFHESLASDGIIYSLTQNTCTILHGAREYEIDPEICRAMLDVDTSGEGKE